MEMQIVNHSKQVEDRLKAITVKKGDYCVFYEDKFVGASISHDCFSCKWSVFKDCEMNGLCKYKK